MKRIRVNLIAAAVLLSVACPLAVFAQSPWGVENRVALQSFFRALGQVQTSTPPARPVRIVQYGDSHTVCDWFSGPLESALKRDFGTGAVSYEVYGRNGMRAKQLLSEMRNWTLRDKALLAARSADLIVLLYGSNEVVDGDWSPESYARMYAEILSRFRSLAPRASILVLAPPDRAVTTAYGWQTAQRMPLLLDAQRRAAFSTGAAFWNSWEAMGGFGSMRLWVLSGLGQADHVHLTRNGYVRLSSMIHYDVVLAYNEFVEGLSNNRGRSFVSRK